MKKFYLSRTIFWTNSSGPVILIGPLSYILFHYKKGKINIVWKNIFLKEMMYRQINKSVLENMYYKETEIIIIIKIVLHLKFQLTWRSS